MEEEHAKPSEIYDKGWFQDLGRARLARQIVPVLADAGVTVRQAQDFTDGQWLAWAVTAGVSSAINRNKIPSAGTREQVISRLAGHYARHGAPAA